MQSNTVPASSGINRAQAFFVTDFMLYIKPKCGHCGATERIWFGGICATCHAKIEERAAQEQIEQKERWAKEKLPTNSEIERKGRRELGVVIAIVVGIYFLFSSPAPTAQLTSGNGWLRACLEGKCVTRTCDTVTINGQNRNVCIDVSN